MRITAVGGYKAVGRNMTGVSIGKETVAIDNGIRLDTLQMYDTGSEDLKRRKIGDLVRMDVIPEMDRLKNVSAQVISHGHLDHIGALPITKPNVPIIATHYTTEIGRREYKEGDFYSLDYDEFYGISKRFSVEFVEVTHSIPQSSIVVLRTPEGHVVYASDFKLDDYSTVGKTEYDKLREIGRGGVKALIVESLGVGHPGKTPSEEVVKNELKDAFNFIDDGLIVATTFSSHIERIQSLVDEAADRGRTPLIMGRSLFNQTELGERFGFLDLPPEARVYATPKAISSVLRELKNRGDYFLLVTGHQAEPDSVLVRMVDGKFRFRFDRGDSLLFCARTIPVPINVAARNVLEQKLQRLGVRVFRDIHVSGHASKEEHRKLLRFLKPEHIIPCHGSIEMRGDYVALAAEEGYELNKSIHLINNGQHIEV